MNRYLSTILVAGIVLVAASCAPPNPSPPVPPDDLISALATGNHRVLDRLDPSRGVTEDLRRRRPDGPYILGRALELRGRDAAAQLVYQAELSAGMSRWAGLSGVRLANTNGRRNDHAAAEGYARHAVDLLPEFRDGWMALGTALYRRDDYPAMLELVDRIPPPEELSAGERVSVSELYGEAVLWRAVSAWETGDHGEAAFRDAFITEPVQEIHERLFLYLFYRNNGSMSFSPVVRLLMEAVYREERGESREALRLMTMIEPEALIEETIAVVGESGTRSRHREVTELGLWESLTAMVRDAGDAATAAWLQRLRVAGEERSGEEGVRNLGATVELIQAEAAASRGVGGDDVIHRLIAAGERADTDGMRRRIAARLVAFSVDRERSLDRVVSDLERLALVSGDQVFPEAYATAVDRSLPRMVRDRAWREIAFLLQRIPDDARTARDRILLVLVHAVDAGLLPATEAERAAWEEEFAGAVEYLSAVGYTGMLGRMRAGLAPVISDDGDVARETADAEDSRETDIAGEVEDAANSEVAAAERDLDSAHLEALLLAGDSRPALSVAMRAALSADRAPEMVEIATLMAELGHTSDALDVARRAVSRAELALTPEIITLIYPVPFRAELQDAADRYEVPVYLLTALVREESHFRPRARSPVGAQGLGQIMPATGDDIRRRMNWPAADVSRPADNLLMSAYYLNYLAEQIESSVIRLAAYNAGLGRGRRWEVAFGDLPPILQIEALPFGETRGYLRRITVSQAIYRERMVGTELDTALSEFKEGRIW